MTPVLRVGRWGARFGGRIFPCVIGRGGLRRDKREGDGATPVGRFGLTQVWWRADRLARPRTALARRPIGPRDGWSDDPRDPCYNRPVRLPHGFSTERMRRADRLYDIVIVTTHNAEGAPGAGSAIFVHLRKRPGARTAGCLGLRRRDLLWLLARWPRGGLVDIRPQ